VTLRVHMLTTLCVLSLFPPHIILYVKLHYKFMSMSNHVKIINGCHVTIKGGQKPHQIRKLSRNHEALISMAMSGFLQDYVPTSGGLLSMHAYIYFIGKELTCMLASEYV
jgi:hypothetical protein